MAVVKGRKRILIIVLTVVIVIAAASALFLKKAYVVPVLMYHSIDYDDDRTKLSVSPKSFEKQMEFLSTRNYNVVGLDKVVDYIEKREKIPPKTIAITFDDGFDNNYRYAYPILKRYKLPATIFVIVDNIGKPGYMTWEELKEMSDSGIIDIGSHTVSHPWLPSLGDEFLEEEIVKSKEALETILCRETDAFCYPMGAFDERVREYVRKAGYSCALATNPGRFRPTDDIYAIKRVRISRTSDNLFVFWIETSGYYTWIKEHRDE